MPFKPVLILFCTVLLLMGTKQVSAQENQIIHLNNNVYTYVKNLQQRGHFSALNPTKLPYTRGAIDEGLRQIDRSMLSRTERFWYDQIEQEAGIPQDNESETYLYGMLEGGFDMNNTLSADGLRPQDEEFYFIPNGASNLYGEKDGFAAQLGLRHDLFYDLDRFGETALSRFYVRSEDYYLGYNSDFFQAYVGKYQNLWAPYGEASTILSDNARSFDRLNISVGPDWFKVSGIFGELDNLGRDGSFDRNGKNRINGTKRYIALHRIDIQILDNLRVGYFDGFIYSSGSSVPSLRYISPMNVFFFDRNTNPDNDEFNALFGGQIWWQYQNMTFNAQAMIDDIVIKDGRLETEIEPTTFAITNSINISKVTDILDVGYEAEFIAYQTYNTDQAEGRYLYLRRGIANQYTDYAYVSGYARIHAHKWLSGLTLTPRISYLAQGEQEINQDFIDRYPNGEVIDVILTGTEEKRSRLSLDALYNPIPEFWVDASLGYNYTRDLGHVSGQTNSRITARLEVGFRLDLDSFSFKN
ncbi:MAG TPA: hypothetical protein DD671_13315 [Balneolaceae bacterium]|nr:hypothetical protein [Balneolaceae bacterium]